MNVQERPPPPPLATLRQRYVCDHIPSAARATSDRLDKFAWTFVEQTGEGLPPPGCNIFQTAGRPFADVQVAARWRIRCAPNRGCCHAPTLFGPIDRQHGLEDCSAHRRSGGFDEHSSTRVVAWLRHPSGVGGGPACRPGGDALCAGDRQRPVPGRHACDVRQRCRPCRRCAAGRRIYRHRREQPRSGDPAAILPRIY